MPNALELWASPDASVSSGPIGPAPRPSTNAFDMWTTVSGVPAPRQEQTKEQLRQAVLEGSGTKWYTYPGEVIAGVPRGAAQTTLTALGGAAQLAAEAFHGVDDDVDEWIRGVTTSAKRAVEDALPGTPGFENSWTRAISEGVGSTAPALAATAAGGVPGLVAFGATAAYGNTYDNARQLGATSSDARMYARVSAVLGGVTEPAGAILPAIKILKRLNTATGGSFLKELLKAGGRESIQEVIQEIPDEVVRQAYLKERTAFDTISTLAETGTVGGIVGTLLPGIAGVAQAGLSRSRQNLVVDYEQRRQAGQQDPMPNKAAFREAGFGEPTRKERAAIIRTILEEKQDAVEEGKIAESREPERQRVGEVGPSAEAGRGDIVEGGGEVPEAQARETQGAAVLAKPPGFDIEKLGRELGMDPSTWRPEPGTPGSEIETPPTEPRTTSLKQAVVAEERETRGESQISKIARLSDQESWDAANDTLTQNPNAGLELIAALQKEPRAKTKLETALLLRHKADVIERHNRALSDLVEAQERGDAAKEAELQTEHELMLKYRNDIDEVSDPTGGLAGQALQSLKMAVDLNDFSLSTMVMQERADRGRALTSDEMAQVKDLSERLLETQRKYDEAQSRVGELEAEKSAAASLAEIVAKAPQAPKIGTKRYAAAKADVEAAWKDFEGRATGKLFSTPLDPELIASAASLAKAYIRLGVVKVQDFIERVGQRLGKEKAEKARETLEAAWWTAIEEKRPQPITDLADKAELAAYARELSEFFVRTQGIDTLKPMIDTVHPELQKVVPDITRIETIHALGRYGIFKPLDTSDAAVVIVRDLKGQALQISKLAEMKEGREAKASGDERATPSDTERHLQQQVNKAKKKGGFTETDPAAHLKSTLNAKKTWLRNRIVDLKAAIAARRRIINERGGPLDWGTDTKGKELQAEYDATKKDYDEIFGKPERTDEQRSAIAVKAAERSAEEWERRVREKELVAKKRGTTTKLTPELEAARARRDAAKAEVRHLQDLANPKKTPDERNTAALDASLKRRAADYQDRIARGDYEPKVRKETKPSADTEKLRFQAEEIKAEWLRRREAIRRKNLTTMQKIFAFGPEVLNTSRAILTSMDFSAVLRQGGFLVAGHPIRGAKALGTMFRSFASEAGESRAMYEITKRPNANLYKRAGLSLTGIHGKLSQQEEAYMSRWAKRIPLVAGSERAYVAFLNRLRVDSFDAMAASLGRNGTITDAEAKVVANFVNVATGRGGLGKFNAAAVPMATVFFAPKYVTSRFQLLLLQPFRRGSVRTRLAVAKEYARTLTGLGLLYGLSEGALSLLLGPSDEDKDWGIELDSRSSDFGKIRIGPTRIDPLFGLQQVTVLLSRLISGETKTLKGKVVPIRGEKIPYGAGDSADVIARFLRTKFSPIIGSAVNLATGKNVVGQPVTPTTVASDLVVPISFRDVYDSMIAQGIPGGTALGILSLFGVAVQTYADKNATQRKAG